VTERALFHAYRNVPPAPPGYSAECVCGDLITSESGDEDAVRDALTVHYESEVHEQWRVWQEAVEALQRPTRRPCVCHEHGR
jgi:hypothetical protein